MKKRVLSLALVVLMLVSLVPAAAFADGATSGTYTDDNGVTYTLDNGTLTVSGEGECNSDWKDYFDRSAVTEVVIKDGVTSIGNYTFYGCSSLTSITIPDSVTSIGNYAFDDCSALESITIPDGVTSIGYYAFYGCSSLTSVTIPNSVTSIKEAVFSGCSSLTSISIPNGVTSIDRLTFYGCSSLESITIPNSVTWIGDSAFRCCSSLTSVSLGNDVTSIGEAAFCDCSSLTSITIPSSVTFIGDEAFGGCYLMTDIIVLPENPSYLSIDGVLYNNEQTELVCCPAGKSGSVTAPNSVTSIANRAFFYCGSLESVTIPDSVTSIGYYAFSGCSSLTSINIPDGATFIGDGTFEDCSSLTSITIPSGVTSIGGCAFSHCDSLESIIIPDRVTDIDNYAFFYCGSLESISIPDSVTSIGDSAFCGCDSLEDVYYSGTQEQWNAIDIDDYNDCLTDATIHYNSAPHSHSYTNVITAPTCTERGYTTHACSCGKSKVDTYVDALGHKYENGTCTVCGAKDSGYQPPHTHSYTDVVTVPTCTEKGYTTHTCACGDVVVDTYVDALGHDTELKNAKAATCTEAGYTGDEVCKTCGETVKAGAEIAALGHKTEIKNSKAATETEPGYTGDEVCTVCGTTVKTGEELPATGADHVHSYTDKVTAPTCTEQGYTTHSCSCGDSYVDTYVDATGHNYKDGACTVCGAADPDYKEPTDPTPAVKFTDVPDSAYYAEPVAWAVEKGITGGYNDGTFKPMDICTRAQIVTFIWRAHDCPEPAGTSQGFTDVKEGTYYYKAVLWAAEQGITGGFNDGGFHPDEYVTRAQAMTFLWRANGQPAVPEGTVNTFKDVPATAYYHDAVLWAVANGVTGGYDANTFGSMDGCTRAQIVTFLYRDMAE